jgi:hypothetical protein
MNPIFWVMVSRRKKDSVFRAAMRAGTDYFFVAFQLTEPRGVSAVPDIVVPSTVPVYLMVN